MCIRDRFVALLGPSGCGKSTLLRIIAGLQFPTEGQVLYRGQPLRGVNPHAAIVFQTFALFPWLTVLQNVEVALKARGIPAALRGLRAVDLLDRVGLDGFESAYPRELSGGMRQKVGFARAMAVEPELLCLDEPFSALDVAARQRLQRELLGWQRELDLPVIYVTHRLEDAFAVGQRLAVMREGQLAQVGPIEDVFRNPASRSSTVPAALHAGLLRSAHPARRRARPGRAALVRRP